MLVIRQLIYLVCTISFVYLGSLYGLLWASIGVVLSLMTMAIFSMLMALELLKQSKLYLLVILSIIMVIAGIIILVNESVLFLLFGQSHLFNLFAVLITDLILIILVLYKIGTCNLCNVHAKVYVPFKERK